MSVYEDQICTSRKFTISCVSDKQKCLNILNIFNIEYILEYIQGEGYVCWLLVRWQAIPTEGPLTEKLI